MIEVKPNSYTNAIRAIFMLGSDELVMTTASLTETFRSVEARIVCNGSSYVRRLAIKVDWDVNLIYALIPLEAQSILAFEISLDPEDSYIFVQGFRSEQLSTPGMMSDLLCHIFQAEGVLTGWNNILAGRDLSVAQPFPVIGFINETTVRQIVMTIEGFCPFSFSTLKVCTE
jgi:hypothetical protein